VEFKGVALKTSWAKRLRRKRKKGSRIDSCGEMVGVLLLMEKNLAPVDTSQVVQDFFHQQYFPRSFVAKRRFKRNLVLKEVDTQRVHLRGCELTYKPGTLNNHLLMDVW